MRHNITNAIKVSALAVILSLGLSFVYAWTAPTNQPPAGNVSAPINTSATAQTKAGDFSVGGLLSGVNATFNRLGIGAPADPLIALNVAGTIKTTGFQLSTGSGVGKVLTSDSSGNTSWTDPVQATGGSGGGGFLEEVIYKTPGTYDFVVPSWMDKLGVQLASAGGGGSSGYYAYHAPGAGGGSSSFGPSGAPIISATGGSGGANVAGTAGTGSTAHISTFSVSRNIGMGGSRGVYEDPYSDKPLYYYGFSGGSGGLAKGVYSVTPGQTMKVIVGAGGAGGCYVAGDCGGAGTSGYVYLTYSPAPVLANSQTFISDGTFTVPAGVTSITVETWGGGGAGGPGGDSGSVYGGHNYTSGGGGGSGGYAKSTFAVTPGETFPVVIGAGGTGIKTGFAVTGPQHGNIRYNSQGTSGSTSSFGSGSRLASATGGTGGVDFDAYCDGGSCNGLIYCTAGWTASGGTATNGNFSNVGGSAGGGCNVGTGGGAVGGESFGAGGNGGPYGNTSLNYSGGNGAVVVSW
ncbi:MAG: hypothetical protein COV32_02800 [Candidatus Yonathbacteria bacterium CG10_big_fil_rev_8_21_14_0_10_43_136]|uniref:PE-PGRS family protein n=1 Tax=Candidatus Nomurabacteria bacterium CG2_30_43_9 TaxID=1805283 RepID=A0A1J5FY67_9BACT|nr:MAG: hypothetical protein AUK15_02345 [Candidatus Nomurabacteria bacterium CG2_30_43_9]PIR40542.1 MAG: hypothetical protein COV32_02800 [Candidatus Yonathbacteria bacterium CG10_big_fil_rev_8_21_14_0_10_43_136]